MEDLNLPPLPPLPPTWEVTDRITITETSESEAADGDEGKTTNSLAVSSVASSKKTRAKKVRGKAAAEPVKKAHKKSSSNKFTNSKCKMNKQDAKWHKQFEELKEYKRQIGDCNVPRSNPRLGRWVDTQRIAYKNKSLSNERIHALNGIGFIWGKTQEESWQDNYNDLVEYKHQFGNCNVPRNYKVNPQLGRWVNNQRAAYKNGSLSDERFNKLNDIGFNWGAKQQGWTERFDELVEFKRQFGNCNVPKLYKAKPQLGEWVNTQRKQYKNKSLSNERIDALEDIGFTWGKTLEESWMDNYNELVKYKRTFRPHEDYGHVPKRFENAALAGWVSKQREAYKNGTLQEERKELLDEVNFAWKMETNCCYSTKMFWPFHRKYQEEQSKKEWLKSYNHLKKYKEKYGHCKVPFKYKTGDNILLGRWVDQQHRLRHEKGRLRKDREDLLEEIGFEWKKVRVPKSFLK